MQLECRVQQRRGSRWQEMRRLEGCWEGVAVAVAGCTSSCGCVDAVCARSPRGEGGGRFWG
jgi:hypothetical protein